MACGLPILISDRCGAFHDLVFPGINGSVFNPLNSESIARSMINITHQTEEARHQMGAISQNIIANYTPQHWAFALNDCIQCLLESI
jgi:glycosyltransferase involved in cell wall biosynthesis